MDPTEISCAKLLNSEFLRGGLVQITPTDPFEEDKGESRSMVASMIGTPQLATPTVEVPSGALGAGELTLNVVARSQTDCRLSLGALLNTQSSGECSLMENGA